MWDFTFDANSALAAGFKTLKIFIPDLPEVEETNISIPGIDGIYQLKKKFGSRIITVQGILEGSSYADLLTKIDAFKEFLYSSEDKEIIFNNRSSIFYLGQKLKNEEIDTKATSCDRELQFTCNDPFGYAILQDDIDENDIVDDGHQWNINNNGTFFAWPTIKIKFNQPQTHIYIANNYITGCRLDISKAFILDDELEIDCKEMVVNLNDVYSPAGLGDGGLGNLQYILLKKDANQIEVGTDDGSINVDVNFKFRKTYL